MFYISKRKSTKEKNKNVYYLKNISFKELKNVLLQSVPISITGTLWKIFHLKSKIKNDNLLKRRKQ